MALIAIVLYDVFETVVVPRRTGRLFRVAPHITIWLWPLWRRFGVRLHPAWRREDFLGTFAPFVIVLLLATWVVTLILGFGLILHALEDQIRPRPSDYGSAFYLAGSSLFTIGFGDFVPVGWAARLTTLLAAAAGLAVVALVISLVFNLYASFARREVLVLLLDSRAGVPPSGVTFLETFGRYRIVDQLTSTFASYELWTADMLDSHLAYPILPFFRSSHDGQSWVSALGAVLDAATLLITVVQEEIVDASDAVRKSRAAAEMMYDIGCHALIDLTQLRVPRGFSEATSQEPGIERSEFEAACRRLGEAGYYTICSDESWQAFVRHRAVYAARLNLLASFFASPPTQWIGDRTILTRRHVPHFKP